MITFEQFAVREGDSKIYIEEEKAEDRENLSKLVAKALKDKHAVFLLLKTVTLRILGYDKKTNEWIVETTEHDIPKGVTQPKGKHAGKGRVSAQGTLATNVGPVAGG